MLSPGVARRRAHPGAHVFRARPAAFPAGVADLPRLSSSRTTGKSGPSGTGRYADRQEERPTKELRSHQQDWISSALACGTSLRFVRHKGPKSEHRSRLSLTRWGPRKGFLAHTAGLVPPAPCVLTSIAVETVACRENGIRADAFIAPRLIILSPFRASTLPRRIRWKKFTEACSVR